MCRFIDVRLVWRTGLAEDRRVVALVEVPPEAGQAAGDLVTLQHAGRHPQVVQLGEDLAVQVGHGVPGEEGGGQAGEEEVQLGEGHLQGLAIPGH